MGWIVELAAIAVETVAVLGIVWLFLIALLLDTPGAETRARWLIGTFVAPFFLIVAVVQLGDRWQYEYPQKFDLFPLTRWAMFAGAVDPHMKEFPIYEWRGVTAAGDGVYLNPARLFVTPNAVVHYTKTDRIGGMLANPNVDRAAEYRRLAALYATGMRDAYNAEPTGRPIVDVELWQRTVPLVTEVKPPQPFTPPESRRLFSLREHAQ
jgi:hypothetical protein